MMFKNESETKGLTYILGLIYLDGMAQNYKWRETSDAVDARGCCDGLIN